MFLFSYVLLSFPSYVSDPPYLPLHFPCTSRVSFPVVTVRLPVALDLGQRRMFNHYWSFLGCCLLSIFFFPVYLHHSLGDLELFLVPMHGVLIRIWNILQVAAVGVSSELSRDCMARGLAYIAALLQIEKNVSAHLDGDIVWLVFVQLVHGCC